MLDPHKIHIIDFHIVEGLLSNPYDFDKKKVVGHDFSSNLDMGFNLEKNFTKVDFKVKINSKSDGANTEEAQGSFHFVFLFEVENLNELTETKEDNTVSISGALGNALASITYSTSRGILMTRFQGTPLKDFILPVIDPNDLLD